MIIPNLLVLLLLKFVSAVPTEPVRFLLYKNETSNFIEMNVLDADMVPYRPTRILCHGLAGSGSLAWYKSIAKAYIAMNYNVIAVDWARYAFSGYMKAILMAQEIGFLIGEFIITITKTFGIPIEDVHIIGHSLGAHIAGFSGKYIYSNHATKIGRITGLDPAGPLYNYVSKTKRLSAEDALFVDVLHTNAGVLGILSSIGHMDFYPDGGIYQDKCEPSESECSHNIVLLYFIESIGHNIFEAVLCDSYVNFTMDSCKDNYKSFMGDGCKFIARGDYFLKMNF